MNTRWTLTILALVGFILVGCGRAPDETETAVSSICGDGICGALEDALQCPEDCNQYPLSGETLTTLISSEGIGEIAILVAYPDKSRFVEGTGVVVVVPPFFTDPGGFTTEPDFTSIGLIQVTFLWPGKSDSRYEVQSEGEFDYGGEGSIQALRDVILFAAGRLLNLDGRSITTMLPIKPLVDEVGIYAYSHAGIAAVNVLAYYGDLLKGVQYYVGYENPTVDTLTCLEAGHYDETGIAVLNPFYLYPGSYDPSEIKMNYGTLLWDAESRIENSPFTGYPYLDLDGNSILSEGDYLFEGQIPVIQGKRTYSVRLTQALLDNQALSLETWPVSLATPEEAVSAWAFRQSPARYQDLVLKNPDLKVMLAFAKNDHAQVANDKPHIHQAFQGFRFEALLRWVRLNPDRAYLQQITGLPGLDFPDNPANTQPEDWLDIRDWAFTGDGEAGRVIPLAALAEMSDRVHTGRWDENLGDVLFEYTPSTPQP